MTELYVCEIRDVDEKSLSPSLLSHCSRYKNEGKRRASLCAYFLLSDVLAKKGFDPSLITFTEEGKPQLAGIYISLAHSKKYACCAISFHSLGCDAEEIIEERRFHIAGMILTDEEKMEFDSAPDKRLYLTQKWTIMESMGKETGLGIKEELFKRKKEGYTHDIGDAVVAVYPSDDVDLYFLGDGYFGKSE